jgi:drug/metabolite transporter (DMT)-like permease
MSSVTLGLVYAVLAALSWAVGVVLWKKAGNAFDPVALNVQKNTLALVLVLISAFVAGASPGDATFREYVVLLASGAIGIGLADTLLFACLRLTGATYQAIVETTYSPAVVLLSFFMLGDVLAVGDAMGGALVLAGVLLAGLQRDPLAPPLPTRLRGLAYGATATLLMAFAIVWIKRTVEARDVLFVSSVRIAGGLFSLVLVSLFSAAGRASLRSAFQPSPALRFSLPGAVIGTYLGILFWIAAFKHAPAGVAALLNQTSTLFIVVLAAIFLKERLTARVATAVGLALTGSVVVLLGSR